MGRSTCSREPSRLGEHDPDGRTHRARRCGDDYFGQSVSISGNTVVVGARRPRSASISTRGRPTSSRARLRLDEHDPDRQTHRVRVRRTSFSANRFRSAAIPWSSGRGDATSTATSGQGAAYVFTEPGSGWANMTQTAELTPSDGAADDKFGDSVAISGNTVVVGAGITVRHRPGGGLRVQRARLRLGEHDPDRRTHPVGRRRRTTFRHSVSISGNTVVVGADDATVGGNTDQGRPTCSLSPVPVGRT